MIKYKFFTWLIQSMIIFLFLSLYGMGIHPSVNSIIPSLLLSFAGIIVIPFSILSDYITKRFPTGYRRIFSFLIHLGIGVSFFLPAQGWIFALFYGPLYWVIHEMLKRHRKND